MNPSERLQASGTDNDEEGTESDRLRQLYPTAVLSVVFLSCKASYLNSSNYTLYKVLDFMTKEAGSLYLSQGAEQYACS